MPGYKLHKAILRISRINTICGVPCSIWPLTSKDDKAIVKEKLENAFTLIKIHSPVRFSDLIKDVDRVLIAGIPVFYGQYIKELKLIELYDEYVVNPETSVEELASTIVHEAQHGRLFRLGFGYDESVRGRIEGLCFRSEKNFGGRIPNGDKVIENASYWLNNKHDDRFTDEGYWESCLNALKNHDIPKWIKNFLLWWVRRNTT